MKIKRLIVYLSLCVVILLNISCGSTIEAPIETPIDTPTETPTETPIEDTPIDTEEIIEYEYTVSTIAGSAEGSAGGDIETAKFNSTHGVAIDKNGDIIVADSLNHRIRRISVTDNNVTTIAGSTSGYNDDVGESAQFNFPRGVAVDEDGNIIVADTRNHRIRRISVTGNVTTIAGSSTSGDKDDVGERAQFNFPRGVAIDQDGNIIVADKDNHRIRRISVTDNVTTIAGSAKGSAGGDIATAQFSNTHGVAIDENGDIIVADKDNHQIRRIRVTDNNVIAIAGSAKGFADGDIATAQFYYPEGVAIDENGDIIVADTANHRIRKINVVTNEVTTIAGSSTSGDNDGDGPDAQFNNPRGVAIDQDGNIIVADTTNNRIRKIEIK